MKRREFITLLGGAATTWPLTARALMPERMQRTGVLLSAAADARSCRKTASALRSLEGYSVGFAEPGAAQSYPEKSIRIVTITTAGSPADLAARLLGDKLSAAFRQPVVVESMVGAAGNLAAVHVARATPDGYTLLMSGDAAVTTNVTLYRNIPYDPRKDLAPITQVVATPNIRASRSAGEDRGGACHIR